MQDGQRVFQDALAFFTHKGVGHQESSYEEKDIDCQEATCHEDVEESLDDAGDSHDVDIIFEPYREQMAEYDPEHRERFDSIKNVKIVMLISEDLH